MKRDASGAGRCTCRSRDIVPGQRSSWRASSVADRPLDRPLCTLPGQRSGLRKLPKNRPDFLFQGFTKPNTNNPITKIPSELGKLIHLRYLNMSLLIGIKELPETLCELYNLQTLNLSHCSKLKKLPEGMGKLINLRHLINYKNDALSYMPKGIERLVFLRTLSKLVVGGDGHNSQVCSLDCLKKLEYLRGSLEIRELGNVRDGAEAKNANLRSKKYLIHLELYFDYRSEASSAEVSTKDEAVLEALHPTPNLEKLVLRGYRGIKMSFDWMGSLTQLRMLTLEDCINCEHLPPLGKLPLLGTLKISGMRSLKRVGNEFLGIKNNNSSSSSSSLTFFPKLNRLILDKLENLEDWEYEITKDIVIMPCLSYCEIDRCPKLKALPNHFLQATSLKSLDISDCPVLKQWAEIYHHLPITSHREKRRRFVESFRMLESIRPMNKNPDIVPTSSGGVSKPF